MYAKRFQLDGIEGTVHGYSVDQSWNGFECPYFTFDQAIALLRRSHLRFEYRDAERGDLFLVYTGYGEPDIFEGMEVNGLHVYGIGAFAWAWSQAA